MSKQTQLWTKRYVQTIGGGSPPLEESIEPMPSDVTPADVLLYFTSVFGPSVDEAWTYVDGVGRETIGWVFNADEGAVARLGRNDLELVAIPMVEDPGGDGFVSLWARLAQQRALFRSFEQDGMQVTWIDGAAEHPQPRTSTLVEADGGDDAESEELAPELLTLLQLDPDGQGTVTANEAAQICHHNRDLVLKLIRVCESEVIEWRRHSDEAMEYPADPADAAVAKHEAAAWQRTVDLLRAALRTIVLRSKAKA